MAYAVIFGSNTFIGTTGVIGYDDGSGKKEFFRIREIYRARSEGSYLAVDVDIKDVDGLREIKLFKSKLVAGNEEMKVSDDRQRILVIRLDGSKVICIEQFDKKDKDIKAQSFVKGVLGKSNIDAVLVITGSFFVGNIKVEANHESSTIGTHQVSGNIIEKSGGIILSSGGITIG